VYGWTKTYLRERETTRFDTGESYLVVSRSSVREHSYTEHLRVEVLKTLCIIVPVTF
jgi:hypothetical protein